MCQIGIVVEVGGVPCWAQRRWQRCHRQGGNNIDATMHLTIGLKDILVFLPHPLHQFLFFLGGEGLDCKSDATWNDKSVNSGYGRVLVRVNGKENPTIQESGIWAYAI